MTRTYAGPFKNPTEGFTVEPTEDGKYRIVVDVICECGSDCCSRPKTGTRQHTSAPLFDEYEDAIQWLEDLREYFEEDYDQYLDENHLEIARMEAYEDFRNEY